MVYNLILYVYALSLLFYFSDFIRANRTALRMGTGLLAVVWIIQVIYLAVSVWRHLEDRLFTMSETLLLFSWLLVTLSLLMHRFVKIEIFAFFVNLVGFSVMVPNLFDSYFAEPDLSKWNISEGILLIHISLAIASYVTFVASAVISGMYLFLHRKLKEKKWTNKVKRLPSLLALEAYSEKFVIFGILLMVMSITLGVIWVMSDNRPHYLLDVKVIVSTVVVAVYSLYLCCYRLIGISGCKLAQWNLAAFAAAILNFLVVNGFSAFHRWV